MAGWIGLLKNVPWGEVVSNAPKIAEGAKSLWNKVSNKIIASEEAAPSNPGSATESALATRLAQLEEQQRELRAQLAASSDLIRSLAEQNGQLIVSLDALRRRLRWFGLGLLLLGGLVAAMLLKVF